MVRKKAEGDERQRRAAARESRRAGSAPSAEGVTTGASKQHGHLTGQSSTGHEERQAGVHRGKQGWPSAGETRDVEAPPPEAPDERRFPRRGGEYTEDHERVYNALVTAQARNGGEAVYLTVIARQADVPELRTRALLHDLATVHGLATELRGTDDPDLGPRYETRPGG